MIVEVAATGAGQIGLIKMRYYQIGELIGLALLLASTAMQIFYVEPLKREIDWRLVAFNIQQNGQIQTKAIFDTRITLLQEAGAADERVKAVEGERDRIIAQYKTADANISDYLIEKERVEGYTQIVVVALFALGTLLAGLGRFMELRNARQHRASP